MSNFNIDRSVSFMLSLEPSKGRSPKRPIRRESRTAPAPQGEKEDIRQAVGGWARVFSFVYRCIIYYNISCAKRQYAVTPILTVFCLCDIVTIDYFEKCDSRGNVYCKCRHSGYGMGGCVVYGWQKQRLHSPDVQTADGYRR